MSLTLCELAILFTCASLYCHMKLNVYAAFVTVNSLWILLMSLAWYRYSFWKRQGVPGPSYLPFCGDFIESIGTLHLKIHQRYTRWTEKFGRVYGLYGGSIPMLAVADANLAKAILYHNPEFNEIETELHVPRHGEYRFFNMQLTRLNGEKWRSFRNFMSSAFTTKSVNALLPQAHEGCNAMMQCLEEKGIGEDAPVALEIKHFFSLQVMDVFTKLLTKFSTETAEILKEGCEHRKRVNVHVGHIQNQFPLIYQILVVEGILNRTYNRKQERLERAQRSEKEYLEQTLNESEKPLDYLTMMRLQRKQLLERNHTNKFVPSENDIFAQLFNFLDPTNRSNVLCALCFHLAKNPDIQNQCRSEACLVEDLSSLKTVADIESSLPFMIANLHEILRLYPTIRQMVRVPNKDITVDGISIPKGCNVVVLMREVMRDPAVFPEPDSFDPSRFIEKSVRDYKTEGAYLAFGIGVRKCIGETFVMTVMALLATKLLMSYEIHLNHPDQELDEDYQEVNMSLDVKFKLNLKKIAKE